MASNQKQPLTRFFGDAKRPLKAISYGFKRSFVVFLVTSNLKSTLNGKIVYFQQKCPSISSGEVLWQHVQQL